MAAAVIQASQEVMLGLEALVEVVTDKLLVVLVVLDTLLVKGVVIILVVAVLLVVLEGVHYKKQAQIKVAESKVHVVGTMRD